MDYSDYIKDKLPALQRRSSMEQVRLNLAELEDKLASITTEEELTASLIVGAF